jgi:hypothetical protein
MALEDDPLFRLRTPGLEKRKAILELRELLRKDGEEDVASQKVKLEVRDLQRKEREADVASEKAKLEFRELQRRDRVWSRFLTACGIAVPLIVGLASLAVSLFSLTIAQNTAVSQQEKNKSEIQASEAKQVADLIQSAADTKRGPGEPVASILLLRQYWQRSSQVKTLADALCNVIANEDKESVMTACCEVLCYAYEQPPLDRKRRGKPSDGIFFSVPRNQQHKVC